jgi:hypothetical protein
VSCRNRGREDALRTDSGTRRAQGPLSSGPRRPDEGKANVFLRPDEGKANVRPRGPTRPGTDTGTSRVSEARLRPADCRAVAHAGLFGPDGPRSTTGTRRAVVSDRNGTFVPSGSEDDYCHPPPGHSGTDWFLRNLSGPECTSYRIRPFWYGLVPKVPTWCAGSRRDPGGGVASDRTCRIR